jgi:hypothetical protein
VVVFDMDSSESPTYASSRKTPRTTAISAAPAITGAEAVRHGRYVTFQMAEVAVPRHMFQNILFLHGYERCARR